MLVLDRTGSMYDGSQSSNNQTKIANLKAALLNGLLPSLSSRDRVGMTVFPPDTASSALCDPKDNGNSTALYYRNPTADYLALPLTDGFLDGTGGLDPNSDLVRDINCLLPVGRTDYVDPLKVATSELESQGRPDADKVIVMISDGAANQVADSVCVDYAGGPPIYDCAKPCNAGIDAANTAKAEGIQIYTVAYGDLGNDTRCEYTANYFDSDPNSWDASRGTNYQDPPLTGYEAMQQIASPGDYYADPDPASLRNLLPEIAGEITGGDLQSRLVK
jgi:hypothetical protein